MCKGSTLASLRQKAETTMQLQDLFRASGHVVVSKQSNHAMIASLPWKLSF